MRLNFWVVSGMVGCAILLLCLWNLICLPSAFWNLSHLDDNELEKLREVAYSKAFDSLDYRFSGELFQLLFHEKFRSLQERLSDPVDDGKLSEDALQIKYGYAEGSRLYKQFHQ